MEDKLIEAFSRLNMGTHIRVIKKKNEAGTFAEKIAMRFKGKDPLPLKNSFLWCETLDACFFYNEAGVPTMAYAGYADLISKDITEKQLIRAFKMAEKILRTMNEVLEDEVE